MDFFDFEFFSRGTFFLTLPESEFICLLMIDFFTKGIGENLREAVANSIKKEYEERTRQTELEMEQILTKQKDTQLETERSKFSSKLDSIKAQLKSDYDNILKVGQI